MSKSHNAKARTSIRMKIQRNTDRGAAKLRGGAAPDGSKLAAMIAMLRHSGGATIEQLVKTTGWQAHSVRGAISGALKKKRGLIVTSAADSRGTRVYRIAA